jgi:hypothetical protein
MRSDWMRMGRKADSTERQEEEGTVKKKADMGGM